LSAKPPPKRPIPISVFGVRVVDSRRRFRMKLIEGKMSDEQWYAGHIVLVTGGSYM
jgi:hypothetical protein